jgi:hypothetical protein
MLRQLSEKSSSEELGLMDLVCYEEIVANNMKESFPAP